MKEDLIPPQGYRPSIFAIPFQRRGNGSPVELLSASEQDELLRISRLVSVRRHTVLYPEGGDAHFVYNVVSGVAETYQLLSNGDKRITAFLFPRDLMGLSENGTYISTGQALTPVTAYKIPMEALSNILQRDPSLDVNLLCKLCHELRGSQHHMIAVSMNDGPARLAAFILWMEGAYTESSRSIGEIALPMTRHDIADYLGLSVESVSRAFHSLEASGAIRRKGPRLVTVLDTSMLRKLAGSG